MPEHTARTGLREDPRLLGVRLPQGARRRVRAAGLPERLAAPPPPGRVPLLAAQRPADGLLPAGLAGARRPAPRRRGAPARRDALARRSAASSDGAVRVGLGYVTRARRGGRRPRWCASARRNGPFGDGARPRAPARAVAGPAASGSSRPARATRSGRAGELLWELGLAMRPATVRGGRQLALDLELGGDAGAAGARRLGRCWWPTTRTPACRVREHPIARIRRLTLDDFVSSADLDELRTGTTLGAARPGDRPPAPGERQRRRLPAAGGRARARQPDPLPRRLRALPAAGAHRAAAPDARARSSAATATSTCWSSRSRRSTRPATAPWRAARQQQQEVAALSDLRAVAPPPQHFAQGRARR